MRALLVMLACLSAACASTWSARPRPPQGSYASRCEDAVMRGTVLRALCRDQAGQPRESTIDTLDCRGRDIGVSAKGALVCPGEGRPTVVLYTGTVWRGEWRAVGGDVSDLARLGLNDRVRSIELSEGGGRWEICTAIRFGGRCATLSTSVPDTGAMGMSNDVSSLRRLPDGG